MSTKQINRPTNRFWLVFTICSLIWALLPSSYLDAATDREMDNASEKLLIGARTAFEQQAYWDSARDLIILMDFNPRFNKSDEVIYLLGDCLYEIGLSGGAGKLYKYLLNRYVRSPYLPRALLGLLRIEYDRTDYARCLEFYQTIVRSNAPAPVMDAASYYAGQCYYRFKDYLKAIQLFSSISDQSAYYDYAQYTVALSYLRMKNVRKAIETLQAICTLTVINDQRRTVIDEAHLTLGYLYYELGYYPSSYNQFMAVSSNYQRHDGALLAAGWACTMQNQYDLAIFPLTDLVSRYPQTENSEEGFFLLGRCYLKLKKYDEALSVYNNLISIFPKKEVIPAMVQQVREALKDESASLERSRMDLLVLESKLLDTLPLEVDGKAPAYLKEEGRRLLELREGLLKRIHEERQVFEELSGQMAELQQTADRREVRRDWRAFAEFGRSRAMFLKMLQP
jgi:tetratricopeptide (TPR) repeat protein